jgi:hypothetical protein
MGRRLFPEWVNHILFVCQALALAPEVISQSAWASILLILSNHSPMEEGHDQH